MLFLVFSLELMSKVCFLKVSHLDLSSWAISGLGTLLSQIALWKRW